MKSPNTLFNMENRIYFSHIFFPYIYPIYLSHIFIPYIYPIYLSHIFFPYIYPIYFSHIFINITDSGLEVVFSSFNLRQKPKGVPRRKHMLSFCLVTQRCLRGTPLYFCRTKNA